MFIDLLGIWLAILVRTICIAMHKLGYLSYVVLVQQEGLQYWKSCLKAYARPDMWINCG